MFKYVYYKEVYKKAYPSPTLGPANKMILANILITRETYRYGKYGN